MLKATEGCGGLWRVVEGDGGLWRVVEGCGRRQRVVEGCGGLWRVVEGDGGLWRVVKGDGGLWRVVEGCGRRRRVVEGCGGLWKATEGCGGLWKATEGCGGLWKATEGCGGLWKATEGCGGLWRVVEGCGRRRRVVEGCGRRRRVVEGCGGFWRVVEGCGRRRRVVEGCGGLWREVAAGREVSRRLRGGPRRISGSRPKRAPCTPWPSAPSVTAMGVSPLVQMCLMSLGAGLAMHAATWLILALDPFTAVNMQQHFLCLVHSAVVLPALGLAACRQSHILWVLCTCLALVGVDLLWFSVSCWTVLLFFPLLLLALDRGSLGLTVPFWALVCLCRGLPQAWTPQLGAPSEVWYVLVLVAVHRVLPYGVALMQLRLLVCVVQRDVSEYGPSQYRPTADNSLRMAERRSRIVLVWPHRLPQAKVSQRRRDPQSSP